MLKWLRKLVTAANPPRVRARYDAAQTTHDNRKHWANADLLSADAAGSASVRQILRSRARYEIANNSYAKGCLLTLAHYLIGHGPRLQMQTESASVNHDVEARFSEWARDVALARTLRTMHMARVGDGEAFALLTTNPSSRNRVKLDVVPYECDRFTTPLSKLGTDPSLVDGIELDDTGSPVAYHMAKRHPGDAAGFAGFDQFERIEAANVLHWFRRDRAEQHRGISELTPALPLFAQLRRYTLAVIAAAETAADFAVVLETPTPAGSEANESSDDLPLIEIERRMMVPLPEGYKPFQIKAEQPTTTYREFKREILNEIARAMDVPFNIAAGNSSEYNYASGRLDHQSFFRSLDVQREDLANDYLDVIFAAWLLEASRTPNYFPAGLMRSMMQTAQSRVPHVWFWDGMDHVDPVKNATATEIDLRCGNTSYPREFARQGLDWEEEQKQQAAALGVTVDEYRALLRGKLFGPAPAVVDPNQPEPEPVEEDDDEK